VKPLIVFDLDGTLVDSQRDLADSANAMLGRYGAEPLGVAEVAAMVGDGARQLVARALEAARLDVDVSTALEAFLSLYEERLVSHTRPYPGIQETLDMLAGHARLAVLTNKPGRLSVQLLDHFNLSRYFASIIGADSTFQRKPDPAALRHLVAEASITPPAALMVGDSLVDVRTARAAGTGVCFVRYGFGHLRTPVVLQPGELEVATPPELPAALNAFLESLEP
jgi:phosphoglycolate phosphatase